MIAGGFRFAPMALPNFRAPAGKRPDVGGVSGRPTSFPLPPSPAGSATSRATLVFRLFLSLSLPLLAACFTNEALAAASSVRLKTANGAALLGIGSATQVVLRVRNEATDTTESVPSATLPGTAGTNVATVRLATLGLTLSQELHREGAREVWNLRFHGDAPRAGHEVAVEFHGILAPGSAVFTPSQSGVMDLAIQPSFTPPAYASLGWETGEAYVLPLIAVLDPVADRALTLALPADANTPHLQFAWDNASVLRLTLGHRGMGGGETSTVQILSYAHPADYRASLQAYSADFPRYFRSPMPRASYEGAFWYHHIQDHPDFDELRRQNVRSIWTSFWFTHLGEYLPDASEWEPYTFAKWWRLGQRMSDAKIQSFLREMHDHHIGVHAYFNLTEYGGAGGLRGDTETAARLLRANFADALVKNAEGRDVPTWEGAMAMNPGKAYSLWPFLETQLKRHLTRLPDLDGFTVDRLDWASVFDYGHRDGLTMFGNRPAANLAAPISEAMQEVCRVAHAAGKRVFANQFYRVEPLRDVDGYCHENDYLPALAYLSPFRFAGAWHHRKPYDGDLLQFEAQLKRRLQYALFPQMIAHAFPLSQQAANPAAADLLELYAPLFATLVGKEQVLVPHCVAVTGANDANLFRNGDGRYVVPVTSRLRFLSRRHGATETPEITLTVPEASRLAWAHVSSPEAPPRRAEVRHANGTARILVSGHSTTSMVVIGEEPAPSLPTETSEAITAIRARLVARSHPAISRRLTKPELHRVKRLVLRLEGDQLAQVPGRTAVEFTGARIGQVVGTNVAVMVPIPTPWADLQEPRVRLRSGDDGTWLAPSHIELLAQDSEETSWVVARWVPDDAAASPIPRTVEMILLWCEPELDTKPSALREPSAR